jgi:hypothetical protein
MVDGWQRRAETKNRTTWATAQAIRQDLKPNESSTIEDATA